MKQVIVIFISSIVLIFVSMALFYFFGRDIWYPYYKKCIIQKDMESVESNLTHVDQHKIPLPPVINLKLTAPLEQLSSKQRLKRHLADADFIFYPKRLTLIGIKHEKILEVWAELHGKWVHLTTYPFTAFSGRLGPKYREGDGPRVGTYDRSRHDPLERRGDLQWSD